MNLSRDVHLIAHSLENLMSLYLSSTLHVSPSIICSLLLVPLNRSCLFLSLHHWSEEDVLLSKPKQFLKLTLLVLVLLLLVKYFSLSLQGLNLSCLCTLPQFVLGRPVDRL